MFSRDSCLSREGLQHHFIIQKRKEIMNETDREVHIGVVFGTVFVSLWVIAIVLNSVSSILLFKEARKRHSWANVLLFCIALLDLLVLVGVLLPAVVAIFLEDILEANPILCHFQGCALNILILFTFFLAVYVSVDQYLALCHPFLYNSRVVRHQNRSLKIMIAVLCVLFVLSAIHSIVPILVGVDFGPLNPPIICYYDLHSHLIYNIVFSSINVSLFIGNGLILLYCSASVGYQFFRLHHSLVKNSTSHVAGPSRSIERQQVALAKLSVIIAIVFLSCSIPFEVFNNIVIHFCYSLNALRLKL